MSEVNANPEGVSSEAPVVAAAPAPGTPEYNAAMAAKYDNQGEKPAAPVAPKPDNGQDKFYNAKTGAYNWDAHNQEVQWQQSQKPKVDNLDFIKEPEKAPDVNIGESLKAFSAAVATGDKEASRQLAQKLIDSGVAAESLQMQVEAVQNIQATKLREIIDYSGGDEGVAAMRAFVQKSMPEAEAAAYRAALGGPNWKMAVDSIQKKMGSKPTLNMDGVGAGGLGDAQPFATKSDMVKAMQDKRYRTDPAYRQSVVNRVALSD